LRVPGFAEEDKTIPRATTLAEEGGVVDQVLDPEATSRSSSGDGFGDSTEVRAFEAETKPASVSKTKAPRAISGS
jgi:hypothetical protein